MEKRMQTMLKVVNGVTEQGSVKTQNIYVEHTVDTESKMFIPIRESQGKYQVKLVCKDFLAKDSTQKGNNVRQRTVLYNLGTINPQDKLGSLDDAKMHLETLLSDDSAELLYLDDLELSSILKKKPKSLKIGSENFDNGARIIKKDYSVPVVALNKTKANANVVLQSIQETTAKFREDSHFVNVFGSKVVWRSLFLTYSESKEKADAVMQKYVVDNIFDADAFIADNSVDVVKKLASSFNSILFPAIEQRKNPATGKTESFMKYTLLRRKANTSCFYRNDNDYILSFDVFTIDADTIANSFDHNYIPYTNLEEVKLAVSYATPVTSAKAEDLLSKEDDTDEVEAELENNSVE